MSTHHIAIIDDHTLFAQSLKNLINTFEGFDVTHEAHNGKVFLHSLKEKNSILPHIALMDMNMPIMNGIETSLVLKEQFPTIKILALSMDDDENSILKMIRSGACGYLLKDIHPDILLEALNAVLKDGFFHTKLVSNTLVNSLHHGAKKDSNEVKFTGRELEFLKLASTEMTYKEIASVMHLSPKTIDGYREQLFRKLNVKNRIGLAVYAIKNNLA